MLALILLRLMVLDQLVHVFPLAPNTIQNTGDGLPNMTSPRILSLNGIKEIQLAQFLENLKISFFSQGLKNFSSWGGAVSANRSREIVGQIIAASVLIYPAIIVLTISSKRRYT